MGLIDEVEQKESTFLFLFSRVALSVLSALVFFFHSFVYLRVFRGVIQPGKTKRSLTGMRISRKNSWPMVGWGPKEEGKMMKKERK